MVLLSDFFDTRLGRQVKSRVSSQQRSLIEEQQSVKKSKSSSGTNVSRTSSVPSGSVVSSRRDVDVLSTPLGKRVISRLPSEGGKIVEKKHEMVRPSYRSGDLSESQFYGLSRHVYPFVPSSVKPKVREEVGKYELREEYKRSGEVPPEFKESIVYPEGVTSVRSREAFLPFAYESAIGMDTSGSKKKLETALLSDYQYVVNQPIWGGKTFRELHADEPALVLKQDSSGVWSPTLDVKSYERRQWNKLGLFGKAGKVFSTTVTHSFDPGFWVSGDRFKHISSVHYDWDKKLRKGDIGGFAMSSVVMNPAMTTIVYPMAGGAVIGAGVGAFKATSVGSRVLFNVGRHSITAGKVVEGGIASYGMYEAGKSVVKNPSNIANVLFSMPSALVGYRAGHRFGYGRAEAYLYAKHTFEPGSPELIRFKSALKVGRNLQWVKSHKMKPLDFAKDIVRMDSKTAGRVVDYLRLHPDSVVGGSAASRTQILGARSPRDVDLLVRDVGGAKDYFSGAIKTSSGQHRVDIHGFDFGGKPGRYHRFGFSTQSSTRIGEFSYMRGSEQVFRKGIGSTTLETGYRWFKDAPDFITHSESLIVSGKRSYNPLNWLRANRAVKNLAYYIDPSGHPGYNVASEGFFSGLTSRMFKPGVTPKVVFRGGGYHSHVYPSHIYPSGFSAGMIGSVFSFKPSGYSKNLNVRSGSGGYSFDFGLRKNRFYVPSVKLDKGFSISSGYGLDSGVKSSKFDIGYSGSDLTGSFGGGSYSPNVPNVGYPKEIIDYDVGYSPNVPNIGYPKDQVSPLPPSFNSYFDASFKRRTGKRKSKRLDERYRFREFKLGSLGKLLGV